MGPLVLAKPGRAVPAEISLSSFCFGFFHAGNRADVSLTLTTHEGHMRGSKKGERPVGRRPLGAWGNAYKEKYKLKLSRPVRVSSETQEENHDAYGDANRYQHRRSLLAQIAPTT